MDDSINSMSQAIVIGGSNNSFTVETFPPLPRARLLCTLKSKRLRGGDRYYNPLAPGDIVHIERDAMDTAKGQIVDIVPRRNALIRLNIKANLPQVLASNIGYALVITTPCSPNFKGSFVDRVLIECAYCNISPVIVLNKCDLMSDTHTEVRESLISWEKSGYRVISVSATLGHGLDILGSLIQGNICALVGQSGVGKSSLVNALLSRYGVEDRLPLRTGGLSVKHGKGCHTTTRSELLWLDSTYETALIDTSGVKTYNIWGVSSGDIALYFPEIAPLVTQCEYGLSCTHTHERGCAVLKAIAEGEVLPRRYDSYIKLREELMDSEKHY